MLYALYPAYVMLSLRSTWEGSVLPPQGIPPLKIPPLSPPRAMAATTTRKASPKRASTKPYPPSSGRSPSPAKHTPPPSSSPAKRVSSPAKRHVVHRVKDGTQVKATATRLRAKNEAATSITRLGMVLFFWFVASAIFNDATPRLMRTLKAANGTDVDVTLLELGITISIAATKLLLEKRRPLPPLSLMWPVLRVGATHLIGCRLFIWGLQFIPVSIAQTIRAANPVVTVAFSVMVLGEPRPSTKILLTLALLVVGFALAVSGGQGDIELAGVLSAVGSVCCLTLTNTFSKRLLSSGGDASGGRPVLSAELQCWICITALALLAPYWLLTGGAPRLVAAFSGPSQRALAQLCTFDGFLYFSEQILQFSAISMLSPLTLAVVDTTRRLFIVVFAGFVLQGDPATITRVGGALVVYMGAAAYAWASHDTAKKTREARKAA